MTYFKLLTHDFRPPVQSGDPIWDGRTLPFELPPVYLDTSDVDCGRGWNFVEDLAEGFKIAKLWPTGRPSAVLVVTPGSDAIQRDSKHRASTLTLERLATDDEIAVGIRGMSQGFGQHADRMVDEQLAWRAALARPGRRPDAVTAGLSAALSARGLGGWQTRLFETSRDAWDARAARDAWAARDARAAWAAWDAWAARAARDAWAAWAAWDAWAALTVCFASLQGWVQCDPLLLTVGIRDAYAAGLELALPVGPNTLGYVLAEPS